VKVADTNHESRGQVRDKPVCVADKPVCVALMEFSSLPCIGKVGDTICVTGFHDLCHRKVAIMEFGLYKATFG